MSSDRKKPRVRRNTDFCFRTRDPIFETINPKIAPETVSKANILLTLTGSALILSVTSKATIALPQPTKADNLISDSFESIS
jgi:hypothetical protein